MADQDLLKEGGVGATKLRWTYAFLKVGEGGGGGGGRAGGLNKALY